MSTPAQVFSDEDSYEDSVIPYVVAGQLVVAYSRCWPTHYLTLHAPHFLILSLKL